MSEELRERLDEVCWHRSAEETRSPSAASFLHCQKSRIMLPAHVAVKELEGSSNYILHAPVLGGTKYRLHESGASSLIYSAAQHGCHCRKSINESLTLRRRMVFADELIRSYEGLCMIGAHCATFNPRGCSRYTVGQSQQACSFWYELALWGLFSEKQNESQWLSL